MENVKYVPVMVFSSQTQKTTELLPGYSRLIRFEVTIN